MARKTIILVRHGQYVFPDPKKGIKEVLTPLGRRQALRAAQALKPYKIDRLIFSTRPRAIETAQIIMKKLRYRGKKETSRLLWECVPGFPKTECKKHGYTDAKLLQKHKRQGEQAFKKYFGTLAGKRDETWVLVCHGNISRFFVYKALGLPTDYWPKLGMLQCALSEIRVQRGGKYHWLYTVASHNEAGHLPHQMRTYI